MAKLNKNEVKAITAIVLDCDELDGWGFTRVGHMINALVDAFGGNYQKAGGYIADLLDKDLIEVSFEEDEVWVSPEVYASYC